MEIKPIPFVNGFYASSCGKIFDKELKERNQYYNKDGYKTSSVRLNDGRWVTFGVHRLMMLAFFPVENSDELSVNHRNLIKTHNDLSNLEWLTTEQNNLHAALFRKVSGKPIAYVRDSNGNYLFYYDIKKLAEKLDCKPLEIWDAVKNGTTVKGSTIVAFTNSTKIPKELYAVRDWDGKERPLKVLDIETQETFSFGTLSDTAKHFGVKPCSISMLVSKNGKFKLFLRRFVICSIFDDFPDFTDRDVEISRRTSGFEVFVFDCRINKFIIYPSAAEFIRSNGLSKKAVTTRLRDKNISKVGNFYFVYYTPSEKTRLIEVVGCPEPNP